MRSYRLKPGTMIEWGNNWARGIQFRQSNNEAYAGFFSQIGRLYNVHHIWCKDFHHQLKNSIWLISTSDISLLFLSGYKSLQDRKESREASWRSPGWDECVAYTVPLIKDMHCRILVPTDFSATQWGDNNNQQQTTTTDCIYVNIIPNDDHFWGEFFIFCIARKWNSHKIQHTKTEVIIIFLSFLLMNIETNRFKSSTIFYVRGFNVILCFVLFYFAVSEWTQLLFK